MKTLTLLSLTIILFAACKKDTRIGPEIPPSVTAAAAASLDTLPDKAGFRIKIFQDSANYQETSVIFKHTSSPDYVFGEDAPYMPGFGKVSLSSISKDGKDLSMSIMPYTPGAGIGLNATTKAGGLFFLKVSAIYIMPSDTKIWLKDNYLKDSVDLRSGNYAFKVDEADPGSFGKERFVLVVR